MWRNLSYKQKVLISGMVLLIIVFAGYHLSLSKTIGLYLENQALSNLTGQNEEELIRGISLASQRKQELDSLKLMIERNASVSGMIRTLFDLADRNNLMISGISDHQKAGNDNFLYYFQFSGMYINMVKFLRSVEKEVVSLNIASVDFVKETDRRTKEERLFLHLTLGKGNESE